MPFFSIVLLLLLVFSCTNSDEISSINPVNWKNRTTLIPALDSLTTGTTYLSVYSQIYSFSEHRSQDLTVTVSMRNTNKKDTIYIQRAEYFGTNGKPIRTYFTQPVFIGPMETVEIIIDNDDRTGGSGANFLFEWSVKSDIHPPLFEAVMISTAGSLGISFVTQGKQID